MMEINTIDMDFPGSVRLLFKDAHCLKVCKHFITSILWESSNGNGTELVSYAVNYFSELMDWIPYLLRSWGGTFCPKHIYEYDAQGNLTLEILYDWNTTINDWIRYRKYESIYDEQGNRTLYESYDWDNTANDWLGYEKIQRYYSKKGSSAVFGIYPGSLILESSANSTATFNITSNTDWTISGFEYWLSSSSTSGKGDATITLTAEANNSTEQRSARLTVSTTGISDRYINVIRDGTGVTGIHYNMNRTFTIYQNPAHEVFNITSNNQDHYHITIFSLNGKVLYAREIEATENQINYSSFNSGVNIIRIRSEEIETSYKIIKF